MTTQLRTTQTIAPTSAKATRKATKDPANEAADEFAAMFASLCFAPTAQPTPAAKSQEGDLADKIANLEIAASDTAASPPIPIITLPALDAVTGAEVSQVATKVILGPSANNEPAPAPVWLPPIPLSLSPSAQTAEMITLTPVQSGTDATPQTFRSSSTTEAAVAQDPLLIVNDALAQQALQTEAARRDANLVAGYLANTTRNDREGSGAAGAKTLLAGNGFDMRGDDRERHSDFDARSQFSTLGSEVSFAATVRDFQSNGTAGSIQAQTISQIIAQAETLAAHQTRSLRLRLRPEELGQIDIQLTRDATGRISAHISAERESARAVLSRSLDQLRETLSRAGLTVDKLQISAETGLFAGNRESDDTRSNNRDSPSTVANLLTVNETEAGGQPRAEDEKLLSLRA